MIKAEQIPLEARAAALSAALEVDRTPEKIVLAALNAWPGMMMALTTDRGVRCLVDPSDATHIILPLTENSNGK